MTPPRWLFFPTPQSSDPAQYIYEVQTDRSVIRGSTSTTKRKEDSTGTESGSLADQFSPNVGNSQFDNLTSATLTVGGNVFTADSVSIGGTDVKPRFDLTSSGTEAGTFWSDNNLDDTDDITITVTLTF